MDELVFCLKAILFRLSFDVGLFLWSTFVFRRTCIVLVILDGALWHQAIMVLLAVCIEGRVGMVDFLAFNISTPELFFVSFGC